MKTFLSIMIFSCFLGIGILAFIGTRIERERENKIKLLQHENDSLKTIIDTLKKPNIKIFLEQR